MATYTRFDANDQEKWRIWREDVPYPVGGSRIVSIMGDGFKTAIRPAQADAGHGAEPLILARAAEDLGCEMPEQGWCVEDEEEPWMRGSLDALIPDREIWEIKLVGRGWAVKDWRDGCARKVQIQALWYSQITGLDARVIAVFLDDYAVAPGQLERAVSRGAMRIWEYPHADTLRERMALVDVARAWREAKIAGRMSLSAEEALDLALPQPPERPRIREATPDEVILLAQYEAALTAAADVERLKAEIRTRARGCAGIEGGGRLALVDKRGAVKLR